jgi:thiol-disulfide isomerase/thioredoxin
MRWTVFLLLFAVVVPVAVHSQAATPSRDARSANQSATALLEEVHQLYAGAKYYHIEATEVRETKQELLHSWSKSMTTAAMAPENRYHFEVRGAGRWWVQTSDGKNEWIYRPGVQEYMQQTAPEAGPSEFKDPSSKDPISYEMMVLTTAQKTLKNLADSLTSLHSPVYLFDQTLVLNGKDVGCHLIQVERQQGPSSQINWRLTLWIDKETHLIRQQQTHMEGSSNANQPDEHIVEDITTTYTVMSLEASSEPESLFAFAPPAKAKLVAKFEYHSLYSGGKNLAGTAAPPVKLHSADGNTVSLDSFRGKPVLIDFWATWCGPCMKALPSVEKLYQDTADKGLVMLSIDEDHDAKKAADFWAKHKEPWPDFHDDDWEIQHLFAGNGIPQFVLIDASGKITFSRTGEADSVLRAEIAKLGPQFASLASDATAMISEEKQSTK